MATLVQELKAQWVANTNKLIAQAKEVVAASKSRVDRAAENLATAEAKGDADGIILYRNILVIEQRGLCCDVEYCDTLIGQLKKNNW